MKILTYTCVISQIKFQFCDDKQYNFELKGVQTFKLTAHVNTFMPALSSCYYAEFSSNEVFYCCSNRKSGLTGFYMSWLLENISDYSGQAMQQDNTASQHSYVQ